MICGLCYIAAVPTQSGLAAVDEKALREHLKALYPKEDEDCEWKEFKNLKNCWNSRKGDDVESYLSAIANMEGGHLLLGVRDKTLDIIGIQEFGDFNVVNVPSGVAIL